MSLIRPFRIESSKTLRLGLPVVVTHILLISMQFVDSVMAGHVSATDLAALAIASALFHPMILFLEGILMVVSPMVAQLKGRGVEQEIGLVVKEALHLSFGLALPSILVIQQLEPLGYPPKVTHIGFTYLQAVS